MSTTCSLFKDIDMYMYILYALCTCSAERVYVYIHVYVVFSLKGERGTFPPPPPFHQAKNYKGHIHVYTCSTDQVKIHVHVAQNQAHAAHVDYEWSMYMHQAPRYNFILCAPAKSPHFYETLIYMYMYVYA